MSNEAIAFGTIVASLVILVAIPYYKTLKIIKFHYYNYFNALFQANVRMLLTDFECEHYLKNLKNKYYLSFRYLYGQLDFDECVYDVDLYDTSVARLKECVNILRSEGVKVEEYSSESNAD